MNSTPFSPRRESSTSITMQLDTVLICGAGLMVWKRGRTTLAVIWLAPATKPSAWCIASIIAAK